MDTLRVTGAQVRAWRHRRHELDRPPGAAASAEDVAVLDVGVQDTGSDGAAWALVCRGASTDSTDSTDSPLVLAWTLRGAPHAYRRADAAEVAVATAPFSEADAAKRVISAAPALRAAGIDVLEALRTVAGLEREIVRSPTVKGELSSRLSGRLDAPYVRFCAPCDATHVYEMPFRLAALQAGLELEPGTSPPVLRRIPGLRPRPYARLGDAADPRLDVVRGYLRFYGPASAKDVAEHLDAPLRDVRDRLPHDVVPVEVVDVAFPKGRQERWVLAQDADGLAGTSPDAVAGGRRGGAADAQVRLVGPYDPYLQLRDRAVLTQDPARAKDLWRTLGRPGAVLAGGDVVGTWRARSAGSGARRRLTVAVDPWFPPDRALRGAVAEQAERLAAFRGTGTVDVEVGGA
ncbi:DNA glycosylase AlkZ-like family protein [Cellulomonas sp. PhB143]|uniref:DNA glycosylase AlkZ-like family protein n=1 Tax=Cellulomonas sp. PhB143 TaxID=2485186 RepID=UPI000F477B9D|nr:crosslink repair DNA glycosylase YcaQ family protein [Cellulomonas sp. PhB143]ROS78599.1 winged helix DNA-binding protein [Cellulomonas sp. PhB143]